MAGTMTHRQTLGTWAAPCSPGLVAVLAVLCWPLEVLSMFRLFATVELHRFHLLNPGTWAVSCMLALVAGLSGIVEGLQL